MNHNVRIEWGRVERRATQRLEPMAGKGGKANNIVEKRWEGQHKDYHHQAKVGGWPTPP